MSIVIPTLDAGPMLLDCLASVPSADPNVEVIVVDNGSQDGMPAKASEIYPSLRVIRNDANEGFARASNQGAATASGDYLLFLNTDAFLPPGGLQDLLAATEADDEAAFWQPVIVSANGRVEDAGQYFSWSGFFVRKQTLPPTAVSPYPVFACTGACLLARRDAFEALGGFCDPYFAYLEDIDLCWRARLAGWEARVVPSVHVQHMKNVTTRSVFTSSEMRHMTFRNRLRTILANGSVPTIARMLPMYVLASLATAGVLLVASKSYRSPYAILRALAWPVAHTRELLAQRRHAQSLRVRRDHSLLRRELVAPFSLGGFWRLQREHRSHWKDA